MKNINNCIIFAATLSLMAAKTYAQESAPLISYSFEHGLTQDDSGKYPATPMNEAVICNGKDGNRFLRLGDNKSYLDLGSNIGRDIISQLDDNYTISMDICIENDNNLNMFCWAWAFTGSLNQYLGMVNAGGNNGWYYEIKNTTAENVNAGSGLTIGNWHTITIVNENGICRFYLDGILKSEKNISINPSDFAERLTDNYIGRSPFPADAYMKNTLFDNFKIYDTALDLSQIRELANSRPSSAEIVMNESDYKYYNRKDLYLAEAAKYIRRELVLPDKCTYGTVEWIYTPYETVEGNGKLSYENGTFTVLTRDNTPTKVGTLQGIITYEGNSFELYDEPVEVCVGADDNAYGYLYCHMPNLVPEVDPQTQVITFALGKEEDKGIVFNELNRGSNVIDGIGSVYPWCRDAFIAKDKKRNCYYIVTTDLYGSENNGTSMLGNYSIGMFKSYDLINWSYSRCDIKQFITDNPVTDIYDNNGINLLTADKVTRVWAPQVTFINGDAYVYYAVGSSDNGNCDHFYISKANEDFTGIESFRMLYGKNKVNNILDADINYLETDGLYHMSYRDYGEDGIYDITTADLLNPQWSAPVSKIKDEGGYEASSVFRRINDDTWNIGYVVYAGNLGYHFYKGDAMLRNLERIESMTGNVSPQHGSFIHVNETEYNVLQTWSDIKALITDGTLLNTKVKSDALSKAIENAKTVVSDDKRKATVLENRLTELKNACSRLKALYLFEKSLFYARQANLSNSTETCGVADKAFNNGMLSKTIQEAENISAESADEILIEQSAKLDEAVCSYYTTLEKAGESVRITNGTFNTNTFAWTVQGNAKNSNGLIEFSASKYVNYEVSISQTKGSLQSGYYLLKCQAFERSGDNDHYGRDNNESVAKKNYVMFANDTETEIHSVYDINYDGEGSIYNFVNDSESASCVFQEKPENFSNYILVYVDNRKISLGLKRNKSTVTSSDWCCLDNFELYYLNSLPSSIQETTDSDVSQEHNIYSLSGIKMGKTVNGKCPDNFPKGIYCINGRLQAK